MYSLVGRNRSLLRSSAAIVAFVYAYFGFIAALHHTHGFIPTGKMLAFSALTCEHTHAQLSADSEAPGCGVCEFQANLKAKALPFWSIDSPSPDAPTKAVEARALFALLPSTLHSPRAPPIG